MKEYPNKPQMNCYNCGNPLSKEDNHDEHIPAKNLFATYPDKYKQQLLTVPACFTCNNKYSRIDQEIRDAIGIMNDDNELQTAMSHKALRSIVRRNNWKDRIITVDQGRTFEVFFEYEEFKKLHIKNFKGIFYHKYGYPLPKKYKVEVIAEGDEDDSTLQNISKFLYSYVNERLQWIPIGHKDMFQYKIKSMVADQNSQLYNSLEIEDALGFVCIMEYHKLIKPLVIAVKKEFLTVGP